MTKKVDLDVRPVGPFFSNYDYAGPSEGDESSPGTGFYGNMKNFKSVSDFLNKARKRKHLKRKAFLIQVLQKL